jgi:hypothetical protein
MNNGMASVTIDGTVGLPTEKQVKVKCTAKFHPRTGHEDPEWGGGIARLFL